MGAEPPEAGASSTSHARKIIQQMSASSNAPGLTLGDRTGCDSHKRGPLDQRWLLISLSNRSLRRRAIGLGDHHAPPQSPFTTPDQANFVGHDARSWEFGTQEVPSHHPVGCLLFATVSEKMCWPRCDYTPFCNGPDEVKYPLMIVTSPSSRFCPWSTQRPPHYAVRGSGEPI